MEEEIFNYQTLRYILDKNGYVCHASLGGFISCDLGECTEYTGAIPNGYSTIEDWYEEELERLNAWKVANGNLVFDPNRYETLQLKCEKEHEDNRYVCHKEISNLTNIVKSDNADVYLTSESTSSNLIEVTDSNKFASTYIELTPNQYITNKVHIKFNNGNLLTNDATPKNVSGIYFVVNPDRTIYMSGIATNDIEYDIGGYSNNTKPILAFKKGINYYLSSNGYQIKMYRFDGTDRTEIYSGNGGVINFTDDDKIVTQIVLFIPNGTNTNASINPMLNVGNTAKDYITYEGNDAVVYLGEHTLSKGDSIEIEYGMPILQYGDPIYLDDIEMPTTYLDLTYMYCMENVNLKVKYPNKQRNNDLTGYETPNGAFAIDDEGNMYCNNATITGGNIDLTSPDNLPVIKVTNSNGDYAAISGQQIGMLSQNGVRLASLSNFDYDKPCLSLQYDLENTTIRSSGISIYSDDASIKINGEEVGLAVVSATQPTSGVKVWIQKSKNYLNVPSTWSFERASDKSIFIPKGTYYVTMGNVTKGGTGNVVLVLNDTAIYLASNKSQKVTFDTDITRYSYYSNGYSWSGSEGITSTVENLMISVDGGTYEPYVEDKIYTKNANGVYEEFYSEDTGWIYLNDFIRYRKKNGVVYVVGNGENRFQVGNGQYTTVGTLPEGFRPNDVIYFTWTGISGDVKNQSARVQGDGVIGLYLPSGQSMDNWGFTISYPID